MRPATSCTTRQPTRSAPRRAKAGPLIAGAAAAAAAIVLEAGPAAAHGVGGRTDLPLPAWQLAWAAAFAVLASFVALGVFWSEPGLAKAAAGRALLDCGSPAVVGLVALSRAAGVAALGVLLYAAWRGNPSPAVNIATGAFLIWFWVGLQVASVLLGDVWRLFNPYATIADAAAWPKDRLTGTQIVSTDLYLYPIDSEHDAKH